MRGSMALSWLTALFIVPGTLIHGQTIEACKASAHCQEVTGMTTTIADFRESSTAYDQVISVTFRFKNTSDRSLVIGYVTGSGLVVDDQGNRYNHNPRSLRGIGEVSGNSFDPKFSLRPGESSDARMEFVFRKGNAIIGTSYVVELAVREIDPVAGGQWRLGREHALQFRGLGHNAIAAAASAETVSAEPSAPSASDPQPVSPPVDHCAGKSRCYAAGPFVAEVTRFSESKTAYDHLLNYTVRFQNTGTVPLVLAYVAGSAVALDDQGNRYLPTSRDHIKGMGITQANRADPSFALRPGESRDATFQLYFRVGRAILGTSYTIDFAVEELEILPRSQIRTVREYTLGFRDLTAAAPSAARGLLDALRGRRP